MPYPTACVTPSVFSTLPRLLERSGKEKLAEEVLRETERALGLEPAAPGAPARSDDEPRPVRAVHFSNFIIQ
jgi:hypothetical protein